jgi:hypothetical protein
LGVALSGANAIDCGLLHIDGNRYSREDVTSCAHRAAASGKPYRFGFSAVGVDSGFCNVAVRTADGSKYYLEYNYDLSFPDGDKRRGPTLYVGRCETIEFVNRAVNHAPRLTKYLLASSAFKAEAIENVDTPSIDGNDSGFAQFTQSRSHGLAIDAQVLGDVLMRQIFDALSLRAIE